MIVIIYITLKICKWTLEDVLWLLKCSKTKSFLIKLSPCVPTRFISWNSRMCCLSPLALRTGSHKSWTMNVFTTWSRLWTSRVNWGVILMIQSAFAFVEVAVLYWNYLSWAIMLTAQSCGVASLTVCSLYVLYVYIYCSHKLLKTRVLNNDRLPSSVYVYMKYLAKALTRRTGCLYTAKKSDVVFTVLSCRWARSTSI